MEKYIKTKVMNFGIDIRDILYYYVCLLISTAIQKLTSVTFMTYESNPYLLILTLDIINLFILLIVFFKIISAIIQIYGINKYHYSKNLKIFTYLILIGNIISIIIGVIVLFGLKKTSYLYLFISAIILIIFFYAWKHMRDFFIEISIEEDGCIFIIIGYLLSFSTIIILIISLIIYQFVPAYAITLDIFFELIFIMFISVGFARLSRVQFALWFN